MAEVVGADVVVVAQRVVGDVQADVEPLVAGKPHDPIAALVRARLGDVGIMVGDRPDTDGLFAEAVGYDFGLVLSGVTTSEDLPVTPSPVVVADDLLTLVERWANTDPDSDTAD